MTRNEQAHFVKGLSGAITAEMIDDILSNKIPATWEGFELRQLLADRFARAIYKGIMNKTRKQQYENDVLAYNL